MVLISGFINASEIEKKGIVFFILRVDHKSKGDFNGIFQFLDPGFIEK